MTGECWIPPKKMPHIKGQKRSPSKILDNKSLKVKQKVNKELEGLDNSINRLDLREWSVAPDQQNKHTAQTNTECSLGWTMC